MLTQVDLEEIRRVLESVLSKFGLKKFIKWEIDIDGILTSAEKEIEENLSPFTQEDVDMLDTLAYNRYAVVGDYVDELPNLALRIQDLL